MRENVLKRAEQEITDYRKMLVSGSMTAEQIVEQSYQFVVKQGLYHVLANYNFNRFAADEWNWMNHQEHILEYLYGLWMHNDMDLSEEFADIIQNEVNLDMEVHKHE